MQMDKTFRIEDTDIKEIDDICNANINRPYLVTKGDKADLMVMHVNYYNNLVIELMTAKEDQRIIEADLVMRYSHNVNTVDGTLYGIIEPLDDKKVLFTSTADKHIKAVLSNDKSDDLRAKTKARLKELADNIHIGKKRNRGIFAKAEVYEFITDDFKFIYRIFNDKAYILAVAYRKPAVRTVS